MKLLNEMHKIEFRTEIPAFLKRNNLNNTICEVGVRYGYNFQQLLSCNPNRAYAIDHYMSTNNPAEQDTSLSQKELDAIYANVFKKFQYNTAVRIIRTTSLQALQFFDHYSLDYVYIDADHSYEGALKDMKNWWYKVRQGGVMAGHDYINVEAQNGVEFGVIKAVEDFCKEKDIDMKKFFHSTKHGYKSWMIFKNDGE